MSWFRPQLKYLVNLAVPAVLSQLAQMGMGVIDTIMAGRHSSQTLATVSIGSNLFFPILIFVLGIFLSINPMTATAVAQKNHLKLARILKTGLVLSVLFTIPVWFFIRNLEPLTQLLGVSQAIVDGADEYLEALSWGVLPMLMFLAIRFFNEGLFSTRAIMVISLTALPVNIGFNYLFLFQMDLGPAGLGYATALAYAYLFITLLVFTLKFGEYKLIHEKLKEAVFDSKITKEILSLGLPIAVGITLEVSLFAGIGLMIASYGVDVIAGHQIALNISSMTFMIPMGISIATTARVGYFYGLNDLLTATRIGWLATALSAIMMFLSALMMWLIPEALVGIYTTQPEIILVGTRLLFFAAIFQLVDGVQATALGALRGLHDTKIPMYISAIAYWVIGFPIGYYLSLDYQASGYWMGIILALFTAALLLTLRFYRLTNKLNQA
jgi:MATE family multidrug resistance protein